MIKANQLEWLNGNWKSVNEATKNAQLCVVFGSRLVIDNEGDEAVKNLKKSYPNSTIVTISTAGNIIDTTVKYNNLIATCVNFEKTKVLAKTFKFNTSGGTKDVDLGITIAKSFNTTDLKLVLLFSTSNINAGNLIDGINKGFNNKVLVSGGVAGDGMRFEKTIVGIDNDLQEDNIVAIGLYSKDLIVSHGSKGGWNTFGPPRIVTKAEDNILYEIDNQPVLDLYKEYLGPKAKDLPGSGLLFPFAIVDENTNELIVRGIQNVDEEKNAIILYGNVEVGQQLRLMRANHSILIDGAGESANDAIKSINQEPELALLVSCVARRLALDQLIDEEIEEVRNNLGDKSKIFGFYSYSEFSPLEGTITCSLHNQTMTITTLSEK